MRKVNLHRNEKGFTLIEMVISILLLSIVTVALASGLITASKVLIHNDSRQTAKNLAETQMEYIKNVPYAWSYDTSEIILPGGYHSSQSVYGGGTQVTINGITYFSPHTADARNDNLQMIVVTITGPGNVTYTLVDYKVR